jgi:glycosyltransferase involved in cell wall biosynthesis
VEVRCIGPDARLGSQRGGVIVCVLAGGPAANLSDCLRAIDRHTASSVPVLVCDPGAGGALLESVRDLELSAGRELFYLPVGPTGARAASEVAAPADLALLDGSCVVAEHWLAGLGEAAQADSRTATATPLTVASAAELDRAAEAVRSQSLKLRPRLADADCPCLYVRRPALELVGGFDPDFSQRCTHAGLAHVLADDVLVCVPGHADVTTLSPDPGPLTRALSRARRSLQRPSVVIDARAASSPAPGTRLQVLEIVAALARTEKLRLAVVLPSNASADVAHRLESLPRVTPLTYADARREADHRRADIVHRPCQISNAADLEFVAGLGDRLVITQQDLIGYFNPSYFPTLDAWEAYRQLTRAVLSIADRVLFFSAHARGDALAEELVEPQRAGVVRIGVDHNGANRGQPSRPKQAARLPEQAEFMLAIGTDFHHKNRVFGLRVLAELRRQHRWSGYLVFAGPHVKLGSSRAEEARLLAADPRLAEAVIDCGAVTEHEKAWLLQQARLVVYPTVHEGFGLVPFEAAEHGVPCLWAAGTSLSELLGDAGAGILRWDATETAARALELMRDERVRQRNIASIREAVAGLTWDATAARLIEEYNLTCDSPATPASALDRRHGRVTGPLTEDGMRLVGAGGALPSDVERPLLALATHPQIGGPVFSALKLGYRVSHKLRRASRDNADGFERSDS